MIALYESQLERYVKDKIPSVKRYLYTSEEKLFNLVSAVKEYPTVYLVRDESGHTFTKSLPVSYADENGVPHQMKFFIAPTKYTMTVCIKEMRTALTIYKRLRFAWLEQPYLSVKWPNDQEPLGVGMKFLGIKLLTVRDDEAAEGPLRTIILSWESQLFIASDYSNTKVSEVNINTDIQ